MAAESSNSKMALNRLNFNNKMKMNVFNSKRILRNSIDIGSHTQVNPPSPRNNLT